MTETTETELPLSPEQRFGEVAMAADSSIDVVLRFLLEHHPDDEDAILSGVMTAVVRYGVERQQQAAEKWVRQGAFGATPTVRDVVGFFIRYVSRSAEILLGKPATTN